MSEQAVTAEPGVTPCDHPSRWVIGNGLITSCPYWAPPFRYPLGSVSWTGVPYASLMRAVALFILLAMPLPAPQLTPDTIRTCLNGQKDVLEKMMVWVQGNIQVARAGEAAVKAAHPNATALAATFEKQIGVLTRRLIEGQELMTKAGQVSMNCEPLRTFAVDQYVAQRRNRR